MSKAQFERYRQSEYDPALRESRGVYYTPLPAVQFIVKDGKVWINKQQYFDKFPKEVWEFYIGGYQPSQKWLKDRKGRTLNFDVIQHYQKILYALYLTIDLQKQIDKVYNT